MLFLDECIPKLAAPRLAEFLKHQPERPSVIHILDFYNKQGTDDREWAKLAKMNRWLPITSETKKYKTAMGERTVLLGVFRPARWAKEK